MSIERQHPPLKSRPLIWLPAVNENALNCVGRTNHVELGGLRSMQFPTVVKETTARNATDKGLL